VPSAHHVPTAEHPKWRYVGRRQHSHQIHITVDSLQEKRRSPPMECQRIIEAQGIALRTLAAGTNTTP
jgi:hypothetical protein